MKIFTRSQAVAYLKGSDVEDIHDFDSANGVTFAAAQYGTNSAGRRFAMFSDYGERVAVSEE